MDNTQNQHMSRGEFLKLAGITILGLVGTPLLNACKVSEPEVGAQVESLTLKDVNLFEHAPLLDTSINPKNQGRLVISPNHIGAYDALYTGELRPENLEARIVAIDPVASSMLGTSLNRGVPDPVFVIIATDRATGRSIPIGGLDLSRPGFSRLSLSLRNMIDGNTELVLGENFFVVEPSAVIEGFKLEPVSQFNAAEISLPFSAKLGGKNVLLGPKNSEVGAYNIEIFSELLTKAPKPGRDAGYYTARVTWLDKISGEQKQEYILFQTASIPSGKEPPHIIARHQLDYKTVTNSSPLRVLGEEIEGVCTERLVNLMQMEAVTAPNSRLTVKPLVMSQLTPKFYSSLFAIVDEQGRVVDIGTMFSSPTRVHTVFINGLGESSLSGVVDHAGAVQHYLEMTTAAKESRFVLRLPDGSLRNIERQEAIEILANRAKLEALTRELELKVSARSPYEGVGNALAGKISNRSQLFNTVGIGLNLVNFALMVPWGKANSDWRGTTCVGVECVDVALSSVLSPGLEGAYLFAPSVTELRDSNVKKLMSSDNVGREFAVPLTVTKLVGTNPTNTGKIFSNDSTQLLTPFLLSSNVAGLTVRVGDCSITSFSDQDTDLDPDMIIMPTIDKSSQIDVNYVDEIASPEVIYNQIVAHQSQCSENGDMFSQLSYKAVAPFKYLELHAENTSNPNIEMSGQKTFIVHFQDPNGKDVVYIFTVGRGIYA